jgi:caa(3)-type oxidase subunit IV
MSETDDHGYWGYIKIWLWLLGMTLLALGVGYVDMPANLKALLLVGVTLAKVGLIGAFFMHLRSEKIDLVLITFCPIVLSLILFFFIRGDTTDTAARIISLG